MPCVVISIKCFEKFYELNSTAQMSGKKTTTQTSDEKNHSILPEHDV